MPAIRIALLDLPPALDGVVRNWLARDDGIEIVEEITGADVLMIASAEADHHRSCAELLQRHPGLRVLALDPGTGRASICRLAPQRDEVGVLAVAQLGEVLRSAVRPTRAG